MAKFDNKIFNEVAFAGYANRVPDTVKTELLRSRAIVTNGEIANLFKGQVNAYYGRIPYYGTLGGEAVNYDGQTDITTDSSTTFDRGVLAYGRAKAWVEKDFSVDITSGVDFMDEVAKQTVRFWSKLDQRTLLKVLDGVFGMTTPKENKEFVEAHTMDVSKVEESKGKIIETTLNDAIQKACGDNKQAFSLVIMHSAVATNLENLNLMERLKQTDANGIQRDLNLGTWNGKTVLIDDTMPTKKVGKSGDIEAGMEYTTYVLGGGAIEMGKLPVEKAYEMYREPLKNGGETSLINRKRDYLGIKGFSYEKKAQASLSPTDADLANPENWTLINNGTEWIDHKAIPMARIISRG